tara:strand:+ start:1311 stop:1496 length:186 start_codon:yes stop_codon:yes gene_type:complete
MAVLAANKHPMKKHTLFNLLTVVLILIAIGMIVIGIHMSLPAPALTGVGFLIIAWLHKLMK